MYVFGVNEFNRAITIVLVSTNKDVAILDFKMAAVKNPYSHNSANINDTDTNLVSKVILLLFVSPIQTFKILLVTHLLWSLYLLLYIATIHY